MEDVIHWITERQRRRISEQESYSHSHPDPTANEAIGNVVREERRKKHQKGNTRKGNARKRNVHAIGSLAGRGGEAG